MSTRDDLLEGFLANDIVGFHSFALARHFMEVRLAPSGLPSVYISPSVAGCALVVDSTCDVLCCAVCVQACKRLLGLRIRSRFGGKLCIDNNGRCVGGLLIGVTHKLLVRLCVVQSLTVCVCWFLRIASDVIIAVSHVGVEVSSLRECMRSEEAASVSYSLRTKYRDRVRRADTMQ